MRRGVFLARATDPAVLEAGQDGGLVSALLLWGLETDRIERPHLAAVVDQALGRQPFLATNRDEVFEAAGSLHLCRQPAGHEGGRTARAQAPGPGRHELPGVERHPPGRGKVNKYARRIEITLGLLCSKSFAYDGMRQVVTEEYGVPLDDIAKVNIKGRFQVWRRSTGELVEIHLKQLQQATREGCKVCPDFAAEHADIATGGLGQRDGWTWPWSAPSAARTGCGRPRRTVITVRPGEEDPAALALMAKLAARSRGRWPVELTGDQGARGCSQWCRQAEEAPEPPRSADLQGYGGDVVAFPL